MKKNWLKAAGILPAVVMGVCVGVSLAGYVPPAEKNPVTAEASDMADEADSTDDAAEDAAESGTEDDAASDESVEAMAFDLADGTYMGTGTGYSGEIKVAVTITNHKITDISVVSESDTDAFFNKARAVIDKIISAQSYEVDTISGATYSSRGILAAVKNALTGAKDTSSPKAAADSGTGSGSGSGGSGSSGGSAGSMSLVKTPSKLKDGVYTGVGQGFGGAMTVQVTVSGGRISDVRVLSNQDTPAYFQKASVLCGRIVSNNGVAGLDTVSGATYSSRGILVGASNAISKAGTSDSAKTPDATPTVSPTLSPTPEPKADGTWKDGVYTGSGQGFGGTTKVQVTVKEGKIAGVKVLSNEDTASFFSRASVLCSTVVEKNGVEGVDTISGATLSSRGILDAVRDALSQAGGKKKETDDDKVNADEVYTDGTYTGSGKGYGGKTSVQVTVSGGKVSSVEVTENHDTEAFFRRASSLCSAIVENNGVLGLDSVSGATYSSRGILVGAAKALIRAGGKDPVPTIDLPDIEVDDSDIEERPAAEGQFPYPDGTYLGKGTGNGGEIQVALVIRDKTITAAAVLKAEDEDEPYLTNAKGILRNLVLRQTSSLDAVSGATHSSDGIIEAVHQALKSAADAAGAGTRDGDGKDDDKEKDGDDHKSDPKDDGNTASKYLDGTYSAAALVDPGEDGDFDPYMLSLDVTVKHGKIASVENVTGSGDGYISKDERYIRRALTGTTSARGLSDQVIEAQSAGSLDAVSGATWSSRAIITALQAALGEAEASSSVSQNSLENGGGQGIA